MATYHGDMDFDWPDLALLDLLVAVTEQGSLSAAARQIGMAQPNASRAMRRWEQQLGYPLIARSTQGSALTPHGQAIAEWARPVLAAARAFATSLPSLDAADHQSLAVAASMTIAENLVPAWLRSLREAHPHTELTLTVRNSADVFDLVEAGAVDIGFVETPETHSGLETLVVGTDRLIIVVAPTHPWAQRRTPLGLDELAKTSLIVRERGSGTRLTLDHALGAARTAVPALELGSNSAVRTSVLAGTAPAVLSELAVSHWIGVGALVEIPVADLDLRRQLRAVWRHTPGLREEARELIRLIATDRRIHAEYPHDPR